MKLRALCAAAALMLSGCATVERLGTLDTFVKCAGADALIAAFSGTLVPVVGFSVVAYHTLNRIDEPRLTQTVAVLACALAVHDFYALSRSQAGAGTQQIFPVHGPMIRPQP